MHAQERQYIGQSIMEDDSIVEADAELNISISGTKAKMGFLWSYVRQWIHLLIDWQLSRYPWLPAEGSTGQCFRQQATQNPQWLRGHKPQSVWLNIEDWKAVFYKPRQHAGVNIIM